MTEKLPPAPPVAAVKFAAAAQRGLIALSRKTAPQPFPLLDILMSVWRPQLLAAITRVGIADALAKGPRTAAELARELDLHEESVFRVLRALASDGLLVRAGDSFAHSAISAPLAKDHPSSMHHMALQIFQEVQQLTWARTDHALRTGEPSWLTVHPAPLWERLAEQPEEAAVFHGAMGELTREGIGAYARAYPFGEHGTVVDIGGGTGTLLAAILTAHPEARGVLVDGAGAIAEAPHVLARWGVSDRVELVAADIEKDIPAREGVYVAKNILHGIPSARAAEVLRAWRARMTPTSRLVLIEIVVPEDGPYLQFLDMQMLLGSGGKERTRAEFESILHETGFRLERIVSTGTPMDLVIAAPSVAP